MTEAKKKRVLSAATVMAVLLLFILVIIMGYQLAVMSVKKNEIARLNEETRQLEELRENNQSEVELWNTDWKIEERARQLGLRKQTDK